MEAMYGKGYPQEQLEGTEYPEQAFLAWVDGLDLGKQSGSGDVQRNKHYEDGATKRAASEGRRSLPFREFG